MNSLARTCTSVVVSTLLVWTGNAFQEPVRPRLPDFDKRSPRPAPVVVVPEGRRLAVSQLNKRVTGLRVEFDEITRGPRFIASTEGFLSGPAGQGRAISQAVGASIRPGDPDGPTKAFLTEYRALFGHGPEALDSARVTRQFASAHTGLRTVVWQQQ